jgi:mgtE-like transporter
VTFIARSKACFNAFKETLAGHLFGVGGLVAGLVLAWQLGIFKNVPWVIAVYFTILTGNGVINGLFSGRLNTALHIGTLSPSFHGSKSNFRALLQPLLAITLITSLASSLVSMVFGSLFWGIALGDFCDILFVVLATMNLGLILYLFNLAITFVAFKKGLDLDSVAYPIIATVADVFITVCYAATLDLFFNSESLGRFLVLLVAILPVILMVCALPRNIRREEFVRPVKASILALMLVAIIANITGTVLNRINILTSGRMEISSVLPALIELVSDTGLVISSTATARLALGLLRPSFSAIKDNFLQILGAWIASAIAFIFFSVSSLLANGVFSPSRFLTFTSLLLVTNAIAVIAIIVISYALAVLTFHKGLDPDHFVVPIENSLAGVVTSIALFAALSLLRLF